MKEVINKNKTRNCSSKFQLNDACITDKTKIANGFNYYFVNVGPNLANSTPHTTVSPLNIINERNTFSFYINPTTETEIISLIKLLKNGSSGYDSISATAVKNTATAFITPLTHIMNLSLSSGIFQEELKIARVIPLFKSGDAMLFCNNRPVSVLPLFSKILERLMYNRLISFINKHNLVFNFQFGFREGHSTNLALIYLVDKISNSLDTDEYVLGLFLDFTKTFDTVNHDILLQKLEHLGIRGISLDWLKSYLSNRSQYVDYSRVSSELQYIRCGVPLLFLLYINDLSRVSSLLFSMLFADDSNMFLSGKNPDVLINTMNTEIQKILEWLNIKKLTLNVKKTHYIFF